MNEFRQDPITGRWVIISADRDARPNQYRRDRELENRESKADLASADTCPFCAHQMDTPPTVAQYGESPTLPWQVCVVPNLFPVLSSSQIVAPPTSLGQFESSPALGIHEVVIESPTHTTKMSELSDEQFSFMLRAYQDRIQAMRNSEGIQFALAMKNSGQDAGASLRHTHSQLFGLPFVPEQVQREFDGSSRYFETNQQCVYCDLIRAELGNQSRVVDCTEHFVAWCPYASRVSYEVWVAPRQHLARFEEISDALLEDLSRILRSLVGKIEQHPRIGAFNYLLHTLPFGDPQHAHYHWHFEFLPRTAKQAGFEWGTGIEINTVQPARAACELRQER